MVEVICAQRKSAVLTPSNLDCLRDVATINLTRGCAHACRYCYARGYSSYPGDGRVVLYTNTLERLQQEYLRKRTRPHAIFFSPSSDVFQPVQQVLDVGYQVFEWLLEHGVGVSFLTKGVIPPAHFELLCRYPSRVRAQIGITTLDAEIAASMEPGAAAPTVRLAQLARLVAAGIETHARVDPILPGMTDDSATLEALFSELARCGVRQSAVSMLFLRPTIVQNLRRELCGTAYGDRLLAHFRHGSHTGLHGGRSSVWALPRDVRAKVFVLVCTIAERQGIHVRVCACENPDIVSGTCHLAGRWESTLPAHEQPVLFQ
jgi:DNA repair photolyase